MNRSELYERLDSEWTAFCRLRNTAEWQKRYGKAETENTLSIWEVPSCCEGCFCERVPYGSIIRMFHATAGVMLKGHDEYFCGIRGDHFMVEFGWSEDYGGIRSNAAWEERACVIVTGNHKGTRICTFFPVFDKELIAYFQAIDQAEPVVFPPNSAEADKNKTRGLERLDRQLLCGDLPGFLEALDARLKELGVEPDSLGLPAEYRAQFMSNPASADLETLVKLLYRCGRRLVTADAAGCAKTDGD